ncbi:MAG: CopG family transcriptional regulator [Olsenella sp.]|nr:CopG family transcriptional regulator [Olsenella sp.]
MLHTTTVRLGEDTVGRLDEIARETGRGRTEALREVLDSALGEEGRSAYLRGVADGLRAQVLGLEGEPGAGLPEGVRELLDVAGECGMGPDDWHRLAMLQVYLSLLEDDDGARWSDTGNPVRPTRLKHINVAASEAEAFLARRRQG